MMGFRNTELSKWIAGGLAAFVAAIILTGCGAKLSVANEQFERGEYFDAQKTYRKVYNKLTKREQRPQRGQVAYQMGLCYDKLGMSARASSAFANAIRYGYPDSTAMLLMGRSLQAEGKYAQAQKAYEDFLATGPKSPQEAENGLAGC
ncbi:MAG: tetratricopeptide repeat protein, partial [Muribaculaceae bacterium]